MNPEKKQSSETNEAGQAEIYGEGEFEPRAVSIGEERKDPKIEKRELKAKFKETLQGHDDAKERLVEDKEIFFNIARDFEEERSKQEVSFEFVKTGSFRDQEPCMQEEAFDWAKELLDENVSQDPKYKEKYRKLVDDLESVKIEEAGTYGLAKRFYKKLSGESVGKLDEKSKEGAIEYFGRKNVNIFENMSEQDFLQGKGERGQERLENYGKKARTELIDDQIQALWDNVSEEEKEKYNKATSKKGDKVTVEALSDDADRDAQIKHFAQIRYRMIENKISELEKAPEGSLARKIAEKLRANGHEAVLASLSKISIPNIKVVENEKSWKNGWGVLGDAEEVEVSRKDEKGNLIIERVSGDDFLHSLDVLSNNFKAETQNRANAEMKKVYLRGRRRFEARKKDCAIEIMQTEADKKIAHRAETTISKDTAIIGKEEKPGVGLPEEEPEELGLEDQVIALEDQEGFEDLKLPEDDEEVDLSYLDDDNQLTEEEKIVLSKENEPEFELESMPNLESNELAGSQAIGLLDDSRDLDYDPRFPVEKVAVARMEIEHDIEKQANSIMDGLDEKTKKIISGGNLELTVDLVKLVLAMGFDFNEIKQKFGRKKLGLFGEKEIVLHNVNGIGTFVNREEFWDVVRQFRDRNRYKNAIDDLVRKKFEQNPD